MVETTTIVMYPAPGIGHIISMVELAKLLIHHQFSITILLTTGLLDHPSTDSYINRISTSHPSISFLRFPSVTVTHSNTQSLPATAFQFIKTNAVNVESKLRHITAKTVINAFIIDLFCTSAMEIASAIGIPVYYFFTSGAAVLALYSYFPKIHTETTASFKDMAGVEIYAPGNAALNATLMPEPVLDRGDPAYWEMLYFCEHLSMAKGIIVNTFCELEAVAVKAVEDGACFPNLKRTPPSVYCIGPLIADAQQSDEARDNKDWLSWLDKQPSRSVVYLCFGSRGTFTVTQLKEIAEGLERSGHRFLWVVKRPIQDQLAVKQVHDTTNDFELGSVLPNGFIERTKERGLVVKSWAPQVEVLSHESVGGFVSHCGWNSVLEGVVAGVPMIAWPLYAEQHVNKNVMVKDMKVAVGVEQREGDRFVSREEVEKRVRELMESERGSEIREKSLKFKDMARDALGEFGSSTKALANLVQTLNEINH